MLYCNNCGVTVRTKTDTCPLCQWKLVDNKDGREPIQSFPDFAPLKVRKRRMAKITSLVSIVLILGGIVLNIFTFTREPWVGKPWSVAFSGYVVYVWLLGLLSIHRGINLGLKLMSHALVIPFLLLFVRMFSFSKKSLDQIQWILNIIVPSLFMGFLVTIAVVMLTRKINPKDFFLFQLSTIVIGMIPLGMVFFQLVTHPLLSILASANAFLVLFGMVLFARKIILSEFGRRFHF